MCDNNNVEQKRKTIQRLSVDAGGDPPSTSISTRWRSLSVEHDSERLPTTKRLQ